MSDISITKAAAAQRQIDAAIRMFFLHREDLFAIHTVAAAARTVVKDLAKPRGVGQLHETRRALKKLYGSAVAETDIDSKARAIEKRKETHDHRNKAANFLKHADKDPKMSLSHGDLDVVGVIADAIGMWINLKLPFTLEMQVFAYWFGGVTAKKPDEFKNTKEGPIHQFTFEQQVDFGRGLLKRAYKTAGRSPKQFRDDAAYNLASLASIRMFTALK